MTIDEPERGDDLERRIDTDDAVEHDPLQQQPTTNAGGQHDEQCQQRVDVERVGQREREEGGEDRQVAVRQVDQPHHAEPERQAGREQRVQPAQQDALDRRR